MYNMEEIFSLPPLGAFDNNYQMLLEFMDTLGNPKFKIAGDVDLEYSDIESLGNLVEVEGRLDLSYTKTITSLPDNLHVGGSLDIYNTKIKSLPNNLNVGGFLDLRYTNIESLPDNLHVGGFLGLANTNIKSLPDNLQVGGNLYLENTPLSMLYTKGQIRKMIEDKGGFVKHDIYI